MAITTRDGLVAAMASAQDIQINKSGARTTIANLWFTLFDLAGTPGAGTLAGTSTAAGVVPTDATVGCPLINFSTGTGYLSKMDYSNTVACRLRLADMLFKAGAYAFNAATSLSAQPSYSSRVNGGTDYTGTQIWFECVTAFTGIPSIAVTYTNQAGVTGRTTGTISMGTASTIGRMIQLPLQAGDTGVQKIESVTATVATVGTFNILVLRPLWNGRVRVANDQATDGPDKLGLPTVFQDSALIAMIAADSTASGLPELFPFVANG